MEIENQLELSLGDTESHIVYNYRTRWTASLQVTDRGFLTTELGPIRYAVLDAQRQPETWQTLPMSDQDKLRIAVRLGQQGEVVDLLRRGVSPNGDVDISLLSIAIGKDNPDLINILLKAGTNQMVKS